MSQVIKVDAPLEIQLPDGTRRKATVADLKGPQGAPGGMGAPADTSTLGGIVLAGDMSGTAYSPQIDTVQGHDVGLLDDTTKRLAWGESQPTYSKPLNVLIVGLSIANANVKWPLGWPTENPSGANVNQTVRRGYGPVTVANYLLKQKLRVYAGATLPGGQAGPSSTYPGFDVLTNMQTVGNAMYVMNLNPEPDVIIVTDLPGDDDPAVFTGAQSLANTIAVHDALRARYPHALQVGSTLQGVSITGNAALRAAVNPGLRAYFAANNILLLDMEEIFTDRTTGLPPVGETIDTLPSRIHPNFKGAIRIGKEIARLLSPYVPQGDQMVTDYLQDTRVQAAQGGIGTAALMLGTGGYDFRRAVFNPRIANGWQSDNTNGDWALIPRDKYGFWQRLILPSGLSALQTASIYRQMTTSALPAGALVGGEVEFRFHGDLIEPDDIALQVIAADGLSYSLEGYTFGSNAAPADDPGAGAEFAMKSIPFVVPAGGISGYTLTAYVKAKGGSVDIGRLSMIRYA